MKNKTVLLCSLICSLILLAIACNLPSTVTTITPSPLIGVPENSPIPTSAPALSPIPTQAPLPADLPFTIDCTALPASRQADCDSYITATRDQVYPIFREVTGVSLSRCYKEIHYIILPTDPGPEAGGLSAGDTITYNQRYSVDLPHRYDVHELLHSISACTGALDQHVLHALVENYVYDRLGVHDPGYFEDRSSDILTVALNSSFEKVKTASGQELIDNCRAILISKTTLAFFDLGPASVASIYQSTIVPVKIAASPNPTLVTVWGSSAEQIEALLEGLEQNYKYVIDVPQCGY